MQGPVTERALVRNAKDKNTVGKEPVDMLKWREWLHNPEAERHKIFEGIADCDAMCFEIIDVVSVATTKVPAEMRKMSEFFP